MGTEGGGGTRRSTLEQGGAPCEHLGPGRRPCSATLKTEEGAHLTTPRGVLGPKEQGKGRKILGEKWIFHLSLNEKGGAHQCHLPHRVCMMHVLLCVCMYACMYVRDLKLLLKRSALGQPQTLHQVLEVGGSRDVQVDRAANSSTFQLYLRIWGSLRAKT